MLGTYSRIDFTNDVTQESFEEIFSLVSAFRASHFVMRSSNASVSRHFNGLERSSTTQSTVGSMIDSIINKAAYCYCILS